MLIEGRWHRLGTPVVYCTDHPSTALLEILVHATRQTVPDFYQLIEIEAPDDVSVEYLDTDIQSTDIEATRELGSTFLEARRHALLRIPSIIMPKAYNFVLNPKHSDAAGIFISNLYRYPFDSRLLEGT